MGVRFHRKIKLGKGMNLNISKSGISTSTKIGKTTFNSRGKITYNTPVKGLSLQTNLNSKKNDNENIVKTFDIDCDKEKYRKCSKKMIKQFLIGVILAAIGMNTNSALMLLIFPAMVYFLLAAINGVKALWSIFKYM